MRPLLTLCDPQIDHKVLFYTVSSRFFRVDVSSWKGIIPCIFYTAELGLPGGYDELLWLFVLVSSLNH